MSNDLRSAQSLSLPEILTAFHRRTLTFFQDELKQVPKRTSRRAHRPNVLALRAVNALVSIGSQIDLLVVYSYDAALVATVAARYTAEIEIPPGEEETYQQEAAAEIVNVIAGNCISDLAAKGCPQTISPPIVLSGARTIRHRKDAKSSLLTFEFDCGVLDVVFLGPGHLFNSELIGSGADYAQL